MSHLSILPTIYTDLERLAQALGQEGFEVTAKGQLPGFGPSTIAVDLAATYGDSMVLGWVHQSDGSISLRSDLQRISRTTGLETALQRVARRYSLLTALAEVERQQLPTAALTVQTF